MFRNTVQEVVNPNITNKEKSHSSRNRKAYHVFLSQYFSDFQNLGSQVKNELIIKREGYPEDDFLLMMRILLILHCTKGLELVLLSSWQHVRGRVCLTLLGLDGLNVLIT